MDFSYHLVPFLHIVRENTTDTGSPTYLLREPEKVLSFATRSPPDLPRRELTVAVKAAEELLEANVFRDDIHRLQVSSGQNIPSNNMKRG